jgi:tetraacyldisaccharide 4'-kinase
VGSKSIPVRVRDFAGNCYISGVSLPPRYREILSGSRTGLLAPCTRGILAAAEPVYGWFVRRKNLRFDRGLEMAVRVDAPVISVGNLTVGGTGKTPLVCWLAEWFAHQQQRVTLISRGYGSKSGPNDEALELAARLPGVPHLQNADRVAAARQALRDNPDQILLLDDAFQHRRIARDLDIVLLDALEPFGYGRLLPRGLLREPVKGLSRAHVVGLSRADAVDASRRDEVRRQVREIAPQALWIELAHQPRRLVNSSGQDEDLTTIRDQRVAAFCGLGNPAGFCHTLEQCGVRLAAMREFPDHFPYGPPALRDLEQWLGNAGPVRAILCTRKDLVKIPQPRLGGVPLWALDVDLEVTAGRKLFEEALSRAAATRGSQGHQR